MKYKSDQEKYFDDDEYNVEIEDSESFNLDDM